MNQYIAMWAETRMNQGDFTHVCFISQIRRKRQVDMCEPNPCMNGGHCVASQGSYICMCTNGFSGWNCQVSEYTLFLLDGGPFCGVTSTFCFWLVVTVPMGFKARMDSSLSLARHLWFGLGIEP